MVREIFEEYVASFDLSGRLVTCEGTEYGRDGGRRIVRTDLSSRDVTVLTAHATPIAPVNR